MKTAVVYKSLSGYTKKYAEWIAEELEAKLFERERVSPQDLSQYQTIIYGGSLHAVGINGIDCITKNFEALKDKNLIVFATGASPSRESILHEIETRNFTSEQLKHIRCFYFRGGFDYTKLNFINKFLMTLMKWKIISKKPEKRTSDENGMLAAYSKPVDFTKRERISSLIDHVRALDTAKN